MDEPYPSALHTDLRRDLTQLRRQANGTSDDAQAGLPLFEKYQFLTPGKSSPTLLSLTHAANAEAKAAGLATQADTNALYLSAIFMGLSVSLLLFAILYVGVSAIAGLEVSYMAFSKEMGPGAQNKGKQQ